MIIIDTSTLTEKTAMNPDVNSWVYNGLDCCVTAEVLERLKENLAQEPQNVAATYSFALDKQAPFLEMSMRGLSVDKKAKETSIEALEKTYNELKGRFDRLCLGVFKTTVNANSPTQVKALFYSWLKCPEIKKRNSKGIYAPCADEEALTRLMQNFWAEPFARYILALRDLRKSISFLNTEIDSDGRFRTSINIAGTNTGRSASSKSDFGTGSNLQNVNTELRYPFISDEGKILVNVDLEQADARNVGAILWHELNDPSYLDAAESGDTHTTVCRMSWPELDWPDDPADWKKFCDSLSPAGLRDSYRQLAKKLGHGSNYYGQPPAIAKNTGVPQKVVENFQDRYFSAFPGIPRWHAWVIDQIKNTGKLTTLYGRQRRFYGRGNDKGTWRKAIAYCPQSMTGEQIDRGIVNLWRHMPEAELLIQVHDSILFQIPYTQRHTLIPHALELLKHEIELRGGRKFFVPLEAQTGFNWGKRWANKKTGEVKNPWGLETWNGAETRELPRRG